QRHGHPCTNTTADKRPGKSVAVKGVRPPTLSVLLWPDGGSFMATPHSCRRVGQGGGLFGEIAPFVEFALLTDIERGYRAVIAHDSCPDFAGLAFVVRQGDGGLCGHSWLLFEEGVREKGSGLKRLRAACAPGSLRRI